MLRIFFLAVTLFASVLQSQAQDNFPGTPGYQYVYETLANLKRAGLLVQYPEGYHNSQPGWNRQSISGAIQATLRSTHEDWRTLENLKMQGDFEPGSDYYAKLSEFSGIVGKVASFGGLAKEVDRLMTTFEPDLKRLGVDIPVERKWLATAAKRANGIPDSLFKRYPDAPEYHHVYEALYRLRRAKLIVSWRPFQSSGPPPSRFELARVLRFLASQDRMIWSSFSKDPAMRHPVSHRWNLEMAASLAELVPDAILTMNEFKAELEFFGVDVEGDLNWIKSAPSRAKSLPIGLVRPFHDVPKSHWAASAVEALRKEGLLVGYPGGGFVKGNN